MTNQSTAKLEDLITYPSVIGLRVIVEAKAQDPLARIKEAINQIEANGMQAVTEPPRKSAKGSYISYTVPVLVTKAENIRALYQNLSKLDFVKHVI